MINIKSITINQKIYKPEEENIYSRNFNLYFLNKYWSYNKLINLGRGISAQKKKAIEVSHLPYAIYIDPTNICSLKCPLCPTGIREQGRKTGFMSFSTCKEIIDQLKNYVFFVRLYNWGEPFLNHEIFKMIDYIHKNNVGTALSTNFYSVNDEMIEKIFKSPLDYLIVSIDGVIQESYEKYRKGGDFEKVINNLKKIIFLKEKLKNKNLKVEWLFVINKYNQEETKEAEKLAQEWEVDVLHFSPTVDCLSASKMDNRGKEIYKEFSIDYQFKSPLPKTCSWLYSRMVFNWDGKVSPCCALDDQRYDFGDINKDEIKDMWNNNIYQKARKIFRDNLQSKYPAFICSHCLFMKNSKK